MGHTRTSAGDRGGALAGEGPVGDAARADFTDGTGAAATPGGAGAPSSRHRLEPLGPAITWEDGRAEAAGTAFREGLGGDGLYRRTGQWVDGRYLIPMALRLAGANSSPSPRKRISGAGGKSTRKLNAGYQSVIASCTWRANRHVSLSHH
jgi:hypothetical protein